MYILHIFHVSFYLINMSGVHHFRTIAVSCRQTQNQKQVECRSDHLHKISSSYVVNYMPLAGYKAKGRPAKQSKQTWSGKRWMTHRSRYYQTFFFYTHQFLIFIYL